MPYLFMPKTGNVNCRIIHGSQLFVSGLPIAAVKVVNCTLYFVKSIVKPRKSNFPPQPGDVKVASLRKKNCVEFLEDGRTLTQVLLCWRVNCDRVFSFVS